MSTKRQIIKLLMVMMILISGINSGIVRSQDTCSADEPIKHASFSSDGEFVLATWTEGSARLWNAETGNIIQTFSTTTDDILDSLEISPDNETVLAMVADHAVLWDVKTGAIKYTYFPQDFEKHPNGNLAVFLANGKQILLVGLSNASVWSTESGELLWNVSSGIEDLWLSVHRKALLTEESSPRKSIVWDLTLGNKTFEQKGIPKGISPDGKSIVLQENSNIFTLWDIENNTKLLNFDIEPLQIDYISAFSLDGKYILAWDNFGKKADLFLLSVQTGKVLQKFEIDVRDSFLFFINKDRQLLLVTYTPNNLQERTVSILDVESGKKISTFIIPMELSSVNISQNGKYLLTGSWAGTVTLWDIQDRKQLHQFC